jgi:hypothetical protein
MEAREGLVDEREVRAAGVNPAAQPSNGRVEPT